MIATKTERGFPVVEHQMYPPDRGTGRMLQASSVIRDYDDAMDRPGTSCLWIGSEYHLDREEVAEMITHLQAWLATGKFA